MYNRTRTLTFDAFAMLNKCSSQSRDRQRAQQMISLDRIDDVDENEEFEKKEPIKKARGKHVRV